MGAEEVVANASASLPGKENVPGQSKGAGAGKAVAQSATPPSQQQRLDGLYSLMQSFENKLGGGEGVEGLYGSITQSGMQKVLECLRHNAALDPGSVLVDIGAGLGRPLLHALVSHGVERAWGVELDRVKCDKAIAFNRHVVRLMVERGLMPAGVAVPTFRCAPVEEVDTLEPATHAYSFWEGVPLPGKEAFGQLFAKSKTLKAVAVVQRAMRQDPAAAMHDLGFGRLLLLASFPVKMSGSGRSFTAYVFSKISPGAAAFMEHARVAGAAAAAATAAARRQRLCEDGGAAAATGAAGGGGKDADADDNHANDDGDDDGGEPARVPGPGGLAGSSGQQQAGAARERQPASAPEAAPCSSAPSPSKQSSRPKPEGLPGNASPTKRLCAACAPPPPDSQTNLAAPGAAGVEQRVGSGSGEPAPPPASGQAATRQQRLTAIPQYSQRLKAAASAAAVGKAVGGKQGSAAQGGPLRRSARGAAAAAAIAAAST